MTWAPKKTRTYELLFVTHTNYIFLCFCNSIWTLFNCTQSLHVCIPQLVILLCCEYQYICNKKNPTICEHWHIFHPWQQLSETGLWKHTLIFSSSPVLLCFPQSVRAGRYFWLVANNIQHHLQTGKVNKNFYIKTYNYWICIWLWFWIHVNASLLRICMYTYLISLISDLHRSLNST